MSAASMNSKAANGFSGADAIHKFTYASREEK